MARVTWIGTDRQGHHWRSVQRWNRNAKRRPSKSRRLITRRTQHLTIAPFGFVRVARPLAARSQKNAFGTAHIARTSKVVMVGDDYRLRSENLLNPPDPFLPNRCQVVDIECDSLFFYPCGAKDERALP